MTPLALCFLLFGLNLGWGLWSLKEGRMAGLFNVAVAAFLAYVIVEIQ
jgi:hypothetical protein